MTLRPALLAACASLSWGTWARSDEIFRPYAAVSLEESWDSNVLGTQGDDAVTRLAPQVGVIREDRRLVLGVDYRVALHSYLAGSTEDSVNHRGGAFARFELNPRIQVDADVLVIEADDPIVLERPGLAVPPGGIFEISTGFKVTGEMTRRWRMESSYAYRRSRFDLADDPMPFVFDGDEHRADLRAVYRLTRRLDAIAAGRGQYFMAGGPQPDEVAAAPLAGLAYRATRELRLSAEGGPVFYQPRGPGPSDVSYLADARIVWTGQRLRAALIGLRELYGGTGAPQAIWSEQLGASLALSLIHI